MHTYIVYIDIYAHTYIYIHIYIYIYTHMYQTIPCDLVFVFSAMAFSKRSVKESQKVAYQ